MISGSGYQELQEKIVVEHEALRSILHEENPNKKVVLVKGVYDLLHMGHVRSFYNARQYGDTLVVAVNSDEAVKRRKGLNRPIIGQEDRMSMIAALSCVDWVTLYHETSPFRLLMCLQPSVFAASHFDSLQEDEKAQLQEITTLERIAKVGAVSTTDIIGKMQHE